MEICLTINGVRHCFVIPVLQVPVHWPKPGPGPVNYPQLFQDAVILATVRDLVQHIGNADVLRAVQGGLAAGIKGMQEHAGAHVEITQTGAASR